MFDPSLFQIETINTYGDYTFYIETVGRNYRYVHAALVRITGKERPEL